ncbi:MAG: cell division protein FtsQ/DivIB [Candidatus Promineifilaceae bacterium]
MKPTRRPQSRRALSRNPRRLRQQPRLRRIQTAGVLPLPEIVVPPTARQRRKRNRAQFNRPWLAFKHLAASSRWISLGLLSVCVWALAIIGGDPGFYLTTIPVAGARAIPASEVVAASGLGGAHIFAVDPGEAAVRIGELPGVISATVTLEWPNTVSIAIGEDVPLLVWEQASRQFWVNDAGQMAPARVNSAGLLRVEAESDERVEEDAFVAEDVLVGALKLKELRPNIEGLYYRPGEGLSYQDGRGWRVFFGSGPEMAQKLAVYETLVQRLVAANIQPEYVSVVNQFKPYYKVAGG